MKKKNYLVGCIALVAAVFTALVSVSYIIYRGISNQKYEDKWGLYDDCGEDTL